MATCTITDTVYKGDGTGAKVSGGIVKAYPVQVPMFQNIGGLWYEITAPYPLATTDQNGIYSLALPQQGSSDPLTAQWVLIYPDGVAWLGSVPNVAGPLAMHDLKATYNWVLADSSTMPAALKAALFTTITYNLPGGTLAMLTSGSAVLTLDGSGGLTATGGLVPSVALASGHILGTSAPNPVLAGNDLRGTVTFGTGTGPTQTGGKLATVTFNTPAPAVPTVFVTPSNAATVAVFGNAPLMVRDKSTAAFTVAVGGSAAAPTTLAASQGNTIYQFDYLALA